ncbi:3-hydroxyisobutyryl-CoA hydrolase [Corynebacterium anserum]|uniref:3-hydroxyisobutyryl-CoA hydrolase n=1 Tax=Corynebacterium anserum TaxID=2684406 RepID=A0A7G7YPG7_9CORY|nr:3-hydroxyisobutyryl-CoA hydrolase [Corynebacterium anserum]MBC2682014.1 enoyl-CoA hydratase/isomerase family protein [Corynebacterium anserum]QNH96387.1 enoyl-CoA hydratase/isomerase family protein [Corynebacterium anserum]
MTNENFVKTCVEGFVGVVELDRPKALNSLTHSMVRDIDDALIAWSDDSSIRAVLIRSSSDRAFCAGGDVRGVRETDMAGDFKAGDEFFEDEYAMNLRMAQYDKPIVALLEGVVMGGGFGISAHGSHRVITPRTMGAMPEAAIGFVPDVGMSHVLNHLPVDGAIGLFIGCTGWRLSPADMLFTGLGNVLVSDAESFGHALCESSVDEAQERFSVSRSSLENPDSELEQNATWIIDTFGTGHWQDIEARISATEPQDDRQAEFLDKVRVMLRAANPASLVAMTELFRRNAETDIATALKNELAVGNALRREPNFAEGVRAVLVDKDRESSFDPADASKIDPQLYAKLLV